MLSPKVENMILSVQKPGRYTGGELNSVIKDKEKVDIRYAFCFPDTYEIGMAHIGMKILYSLINERDDAWCERVFAPWVDMEEKMRENDISLYALESGDPIKDFDIIGFTLQYELSYTNVLNMLSLSGVPVRSEDRTELTPIVVAGGPCVCNGEPMADFIDVMLPGEGEEITNTFLDLFKQYKLQGKSKRKFLEACAGIDGLYVPSLYEVSYNPDSTIEKIKPLQNAPAKVRKSVVRDIDKMFYPEKFVVPFIDVVHDRTTAEIFRGCIRGCRFCQAGFLYRPIREKSAATVDEQCRKIYESSGYEEISLCSLSTSDYTKLDELLDKLLDWTIDEKVNISLPSLRADNFSKELVEKLSKVRKSGLTFAAEAGTQRLRDVINKNVTEQEVLESARKAFKSGWTGVKLYFMIGLPTETDEDIAAIAELSQKVVDEYYKIEDRPKGKGVSVSISVASFVPKPFTPFQWERQDTMQELKRKQEFLESCIKTKKITVGWNDTRISFLEGVLARGDRRLGKVIETAWEKGCTFDSWDDRFNFEKWLEAFEEHGIDPSFYANRKRDFDEVLPWDHLDYGIPKSFFKRENEKAFRGETTVHCREKCNACGANKLCGGECDAMRQSVVSQKRES